MMKDKNFQASLFFFAIGILFCIFFFREPVHDFGNYYFGSKLALQGADARDIYEPYKFNEMIRALPDIQRLAFFENYAVVPPFTLFFYIPFTFFDVYVSKFLFNLISVLVFCFFLFKLLKHLNIQSQLVFLLPLVLIIPFRNNILFGQTYLLMTGFLMAGLLAEVKKKNVAAAIFYSLAIALKISPAILLFYLLARKNFKVAAFTIIVSSALFLSAVYFTGWNFMMEYIFEYIPRMSVNEINDPFATNYQSITVFLRNIFIPDQLLNPSAPFNSIFAFRILGGLITGILFFFFGKRILKGEDNFSCLAFTLMSGFLFTAYTSTYSLIFLLPLCIDALRKNNSRMMIILALVFLIGSVPVSSFEKLPLLLRFPRLCLLLVLFFMLVHREKISSKNFLWLGLSIVFFISITFVSAKQPTDKCEYFFNKEESLLSFDFEFSGKNLLLKVLESKGVIEKIIPLNDSVFSVQNLTLKNNQIYFPDQLTFGSDHKLKPVLINNKEIVYLSDKNRGIGFYTLRKIQLK